MRLPSRHRRCGAAIGSMPAYDGFWQDYDLREGYKNAMQRRVRISQVDNVLQAPQRPPSIIASSHSNWACEHSDKLSKSCGSGNETRALLQAGWDVLAIDREPAAIEMVHAIGLDHPAAKLETAIQRFESIEALPSSSLIHAGMALPFCHPDHFEKFWSVVMSALLPGGVFVGQLFGDKDDWASDPERTFH